MSVPTTLRETPLACGQECGPAARPLVPIYTYILKIASRCNLNCDYCFVYNSADAGWKRQPKKMSLEVIQQTARRIRNHAESHAMTGVSVVFHGGEPLLVGHEYLGRLLSSFKSAFGDSSVHVSFGIQSNGLLFSAEIGDVLLEHGATIGVSLDGPPRINDLHRVDLQGQPCTDKLEACLQILCSPRYRSLFSGFLSVITLASDPIDVISYLHSYEPPGIDFILPYDNHDRYPTGKEDFESVEYGRWLVRLFDYWFDNIPQLRVRIFDSLLRIFFGGTSLVESIGTSPVDLIVVETNGEIEAVDSLKSTFQGATALGLTVFDHSFDIAANHVAVRARQAGSTGLCSTCRQCDIVEFCGGGYSPNRYSSQRGYDNPSVYCRDLELLIRHVSARVRPKLMQAGLLTVGHGN